MTPVQLDQQLQVGLKLHEAGRFAEAEDIYRQILSDNPDHAQALNLLGALGIQFNLPAQAVPLLRRAVAIEPQVALYHMNLGSALMSQLDWLPESIEHLQKAVDLQPTLPEAHFNLGLALSRNLQFDQSIAALQQALRLRPNWPEALYNLGLAHDKKDEPDIAAQCLERAIALKPDYAAAIANLGEVRKKQGRSDEWIKLVRHAIEIDPNSSLLHGAFLYAMHMDPRFDPQTILDEHRQWDKRHAQPLRSSIAHTNDRSPDRRLKIGYVSPDLRDHPAGRFLTPLLSNHNHQQFEIICFADVQVPDAITKSLRARTDGWHSLVGLTDAQAADLIRAQQIDILIDLAMHTADNRLLAFARKPAPVQATWLGYAGMTGMTTIDYRISDPYLDPPGSDANYVEKTIRLPHCFWCYQPDENSPDPGPLPAIQNGHITFGCLNNSAKVNPETLKSWAELMRTIPGSRIILYSAPGRHREIILDPFIRAGIDSSRIEFVSRMDRTQYFQTYQQIDIALDPFPFGGGTTTCDALWMGVPVITRVGATAVSRAGLSILSNMGRPEFIAQTEAQYIFIAAMLAADLPRLASIRAGLRRQMAASPLLDGKQFAADMESVFRQMWRAYCACPV